MKEGSPGTGKLGFLGSLTGIVIGGHGERAAITEIVFSYWHDKGCLWLARSARFQGFLGLAKGPSAERIGRYAAVGSDFVVARLRLSGRSRQSARAWVDRVSFNRGRLRSALLLFGNFVTNSSSSSGLSGQRRARRGSGLRSAPCWLGESAPGRDVHGR